MKHSSRKLDNTAKAFSPEEKKNKNYTLGNDRTHYLSIVFENVSKNLKY